MYVSIKKSNSKGKKLTAIFYDNNKKKIKTTHFGATGYNDYTIYNRTKGKTYADERKRLYLQRHSNERGDYMSASVLSKEILWNKPTISSSINSYISKHNLKLI